MRKLLWKPGREFTLFQYLPRLLMLLITRSRSDPSFTHMQNFTVIVYLSEYAGLVAQVCWEQKENQGSYVIQ